MQPPKPVVKTPPIPPKPGTKPPFPPAKGKVPQVSLKESMARRLQK